MLLMRHIAGEHHETHAQHHQGGHRVDRRAHRTVPPAGGMRGSHQMPLMPVPLNTGTSYFDGPPLVSCAALSEHEGRFSEPLDAFSHPFWTTLRERVADKALEMRRQGFFGAAMLPMSELEYTGITEKLKTLDREFRVRARSGRRRIP
jgi:fructose 1,6-bisphosphate aldolase/phosphatase